MTCQSVLATGTPPGARPRARRERKQGMELTTIVWIILGVIIAWVVLDLLVAGGGMSSGMMAGMAGMMGSPIGGSIVLLLVVIGLLLYWLS